MFPLSLPLSSTLIKRNWVFWGMFLICNANRKNKHTLLNPYSWAFGICLKCYITGKSLYPKLNYLPLPTLMSWILSLMFVLLDVVLSPFLFLHKDYAMSKGEIRLLYSFISLFNVHSIFHLGDIQWIIVG